MQTGSPVGPAASWGCDVRRRRNILGDIDVDILKVDFQDLSSMPGNTGEMVCWMASCDNIVLGH